MSRRRMTAVAASTVALFLSAAVAQTPPPAGGTPDAGLEVRATQAFNKQDYATALPMLQKLEADLRNDPNAADRLAVVQEQVRVCQRNQAAPTPAAPPAGGSLSAGRTPHPAPKDGQVLDLTIKELGNFDYDPDQNTPIPGDVRALSDHTVRLHGFMIPMDQAENVTKFALVPSLFNCCQLGGPPQVQHTVVVTCVKGKAVAYYPDEIIVEGKLTVDVVKDDGFVVGIFSVQTSSVKPAAK